MHTRTENLTVTPPAEYNKQLEKQYAEAIHLLLNVHRVYEMYDDKPIFATRIARFLDKIEALGDKLDAPTREAGGVERG